MRFSVLLPLIVSCAAPIETPDTTTGAPVGNPGITDASSDPLFAKCAMLFRSPSAFPPSCGCSTRLFQFPNECMDLDPNALCKTLCGSNPPGQWEDVGPATPPHTLSCRSSCGAGGRRPSGLVDDDTSSSRGGTLGEFFSECARLEAASIPAFRVLRRELRMHGAPVDLVRRAREAALDEIRHARAMIAIARRYGGDYVRPVIVSTPRARSLEAIAVENAVEGCVGESFAAAIARWQATRARDGEVRRTLDGIATDEARHADLAWDVHDWVMAQLDNPARERRDAVARLRTSRMPDDPLHLAGLPSNQETEHLAALLDDVLWNAA